MHEAGMSDEELRKKIAERPSAFIGAPVKPVDYADGTTIYEVVLPGAIHTVSMDVSLDFGELDAEKPGTHKGPGSDSSAG